MLSTTAQHLIAYRRELLDGGLALDLVDALVKSAAQAVVVNEGLQTLSANPVRFVVCAGTPHQAKRWVEKHNLYPRQVVIADHVNTLHGLGDVAVVTLPGFRARPEAQQITDALTAMQDTDRDFVKQYTNPGMITTDSLGP